jgi:hypothetical protein
LRHPKAGILKIIPGGRGGRQSKRESVMKNLKKLGAAVVLSAMVVGSGAALSACAYGGVATTPDGTVIIVRNDLILAGLLRRVYVCKTVGSALNCVEAAAP